MLARLDSVISYHENQHLHSHPNHTILLDKMFGLLLTRIKRALKFALTKCVAVMKVVVHVVTMACVRCYVTMACVCCDVTVRRWSCCSLSSRQRSCMVTMRWRMYSTSSLSWRLGLSATSSSKGFSGRPVKSPTSLSFLKLIGQGKYWTIHLRINFYYV